MKTTILIAIFVLANATGDVFLKKGMNQVGEILILKPRELLSIGRKTLVNKNFLMGVFLMAVTFSSFLTLLSWADLSFVFPTNSLVYVISTLGAKFILRETVTTQRWAGILLVCLGVAATCLP